jgi:hypothetical protein
MSGSCGIMATANEPKRTVSQMTNAEPASMTPMRNSVLRLSCRRCPNRAAPGRRPSAAGRSIARGAPVARGDSPVPRRQFVQ